MKKILTLLFVLLLTSLYANDTFKVKTIKGKELTFIGTNKGMEVKEYKGKVILLEFWGTWCGPCLLSIPHQEEIEKKYKDKVKVIAFETTDSVDRKSLLKFVDDPANNIDFSHVQEYLKNKAKTPAQKKELQEPIEKLKEFMAKKKKITYDVIAYEDGKDLIGYIGHRAQWPGYIPFLLIMDKDGSLAQIIPGMPNAKKLDDYLKELIK